MSNKGVEKGKEPKRDGIYDSIDDLKLDTSIHKGNVTLNSTGYFLLISAVSYRRMSRADVEGSTFWRRFDHGNKSYLGQKLVKSCSRSGPLMGQHVGQILVLVIVNVSFSICRPYPTQRILRRCLD